MIIPNNSDYFWTLSVKNLGRIASAEVDVSPMTLFIGDNNSGKSYLMTMIYTLLNIRWYYESFDMCKRTNEYRRCRQWLQERFLPFDAAIEDITPENLEMFQSLLNRIIKQNLKKISYRGFNEDIEIGSIAVRFNYRKGLSIHYTSTKITAKDEIRYSVAFKDKGKSDNRFTRAILDKPSDDFILSFILEFLIKAGFKTQLVEDACYLPASRTGFLLNYRSIVKSTISDSYDNDNNRTGGLTRPYSDFLKNLTSISQDYIVQRHEETVSFIENSMTDGSIRATFEGPQASFVYHPKEMDHVLPMYLSSGVVTEIAPLILMLMYHWFETLFIEEPEISLHPQLQQKMACVLIRLSNKGVPLFVSTHSDVILQHINNMIKLNKSSKSKQTEMMNLYGYQTDDLLPEERVSMYQFNVDRKSGKSAVTKLSCGPYGFEIPSFNDALSILQQQTYHFEEAAE